MKRALSVVFLTLVLLTQLLVAKTQPASQSQSGSSSSTSHASQQSQANCTDNGTYVNSKGQTVKRPETCSSAPPGCYRTTPRREL